MLSEIPEFCEKLQSTERRPKIVTLEKLQGICDSKEISTDDVKTIFDDLYLYILKCYSDRFESVREQAANTVTRFLERLPPIDFHLANILSTLVERMGKIETVEESEEVRLIYVQQLHKLIKQYSGVSNQQVLPNYYVEITQILIKSVKDAYPSVQREACAAIVSLSRASETYFFRQFAESLAKAIYGMLNHKHSSSRISAIEALAQLSLHVDASEDGLKNLIMAVSPLLMDTMPMVRRECGEFGILMLRDLKDRYSYFERIIPLVLCCLKDDSSEVKDYILPRWIECGKLYYEENETELSKQEIGEVIQENYPKDVKRPTIGCRGLVQRSLRLLALITRESSDWKENVRLHSMKLLYQFVLHAEDAMTAKFFEIYPDVARACNDSDRDTSNEALKVADLMGRVMVYDTWIEHAIEGLEKHIKVGYLKCFYQMFSASKNPTQQDISKLSKMLITPDFSQTLKPEFQTYLLKMVETLLEKSNHQNVEKKNQNVEIDKGEFKEKEASSEENKVGSASEQEYENLLANCYIITIKVMSLALNNELAIAEELQKKSLTILEEIATRKNVTIGVLHELYLEKALQYVENLDAHLEASSEPILLLHGLISICKFRPPYLEQLKTKIIMVYEHCADEAKVKIFSIVSIVMLNWHDTINRDIEESTKILNDFVCAVVEPHLMWKAGANAEAMRSMSTATLCSISQGAPEEALQVLPKLCKYIPTLLEDRYVATRLYAVKSLLNFGELELELIKPIAYGVMQRLDDPSSGVREIAAIAIPKLRPILAVSNEDDVSGDGISHDQDVWNEFIKMAIDILILHFEGPDLRLKVLVKNTLLELGKQYPEIFKTRYAAAISASGGDNESLKELSNEFADLNIV